MIDFESPNKAINSSSIFEIGHAKKFLIELRTFLKTNIPKFQEIISSAEAFTEEVEALPKVVIQK